MCFQALFSSWAKVAQSRTLENVWSISAHNTSAPPWYSTGLCILFHYYLLFSLSHAVRWPGCLPSALALSADAADVLDAACMWLPPHAMNASLFYSRYLWIVSDHNPADVYLVVSRIWPERHAYSNRFTTCCLTISQYRCSLLASPVFRLRPHTFTAGGAVYRT